MIKFYHNDNKMSKIYGIACGMLDFIGLLCFLIGADI